MKIDGAKGADADRAEFTSGLVAEERDDLVDGGLRGSSGNGGELKVVGSGADAAHKFRSSCLDTPEKAQAILATGKSATT